MVILLERHVKVSFRGIMGRDERSNYAEWQGYNALFT